MSEEVIQILARARRAALLVREDLASLRTIRDLSGRRGIRETLRQADRLASNLDELASQVAGGRLELQVRDFAR